MARVLVRVAILNRLGSILPTFGKRRRLQGQTVNVEPVCLVKLRQLAERPVDRVRFFRSVLRRDIDVDRGPERLRGVGEGAQDRLGPEDPQLRVLRNVAGGANGMLQLVFSHRPCPPGSSVALRPKERRRTGAIGVDVLRAHRGAAGTSVAAVPTIDREFAATHSSPALPRGRLKSLENGPKKKRSKGSFV